MQNGCKKITNVDVMTRLEPIFQEVYGQAKSKNPELSNNIKMFISENEQPNAFATGRKTVCVTTGLLSYTDEQIKGVLGHEFGHLAHKDTDAILVVAVGNFIISAIFFIVRVLSNICMTIAQIVTIFSSEGIGGIVAAFFIGFGKVVSDFILMLMMRIWTQIGVWLCMYSSRKNEYEADIYSYECGYGNGLCQVLESFGFEKGATGLFAALASSHPNTADRINRLRSLGCIY